MIVFLYSLTDIQILALFVGMAITVVVLIPGQIRCLAKPLANSDAAEWAIRGMGTIITASIFVLGFSLVQTQSAFNRVEQQVSAEASTVNQLDRLLTRFGDPKIAEIRAGLQAYTHSVIADEWPVLREGRGSNNTRAAFDPVSRGVLSLEPTAGRQATIYGEIVRKTDDVAEMREQRIENAIVALPTLFWLVTVLLLLLMSMMAALIDRTLARTLGMSAQVAAVSALLAMVFINDRPFLGETSVKSTAFEKTLVIITSRKI